MPQERPPIGRKFRLKGKIYVYDKATGKMVEKKPENEKDQNTGRMAEDCRDMEFHRHL